MPAPRVLVVEDESIVALHLRQQLTKLGYDVPDTASSGEQALRVIEHSPPDLVLMDINLEGALDGIATASRIAPGFRIPVIYLTAYSEDATLARASATNPYGYLLKPFSERELHAMIQMALARCRSERAAAAALDCRRQAEKMTALGELAAGVANDFDNLLTVIYSQLEVLGERAIANPDLAEPVQEAFGEAIEKEKLIRRLLAFAGQQRLTPGPVIVGDVVARTIRQTRARNGRSLDIDSTLPRDLWPVRIDANSFENALHNLIANAHDAMPDGGSVGIEGKNIDLDAPPTGASPEFVPDRYVMLSVRDTGGGMPAHVVERAFEPFFTTRPGGDGLGLSLVYGFVRQSGGHISIDSNPGQGTTVRLWLPAADGGMDVAARPVRSVIANGELHRRAAAMPPLPREVRRPEHRLERGISAGDTPPVPWHRADNALFASVRDAGDNVGYRLVVEPMPRRNGWDWTVWRPADAGETPRHGRATSLEIAMEAAEAAARQWIGTTSRPH